MLKNTIAKSQGGFDEILSKFAENCTRKNVLITLGVGTSVYIAARLLSPKAEITKSGNTTLVGIYNEGATCYLASLLQSLYHIPAFRHKIFSMNAQYEGSILYELQNIFYNLYKGDGTVSIAPLLHSFGWSNEESSYQQDVHELLRVLFETIEAKKKGVIKNLFSGISIREIKCRKVDYSSKKYEDFFDIDLDIAGCKDLKESLAKYCKGDALLGDNRYRTEQYGLQEADIFTSFEKLPSILMLHLKRFVYTGFGSTKVTQDFEFPKEMTLKEGDQDYTFHLSTILVHLGSTTNSGHYIAHIQVHDKWYEFNDEDVSEINEKRAIDGNFGGTSCAYMLIYVKDTEWNKIYKDYKIPDTLKDRIRGGMCNIL
jgi:ubiquitin carboxyl-terminal hydrolase 7